MNLNNPVLDDGMMPEEDVDVVEVQVRLADVVDVLGLDRCRPEMIIVTQQLYSLQQSPLRTD